MNDILSKWREEQLQIASKLRTVDDDVSQLESCQGSSNMFSRARISHSIKDKLIGGVDVSFGEDDEAIAVYVITRNHEIIYQDNLVYTISQPYVSSYLAFREIEPLQTLIERQKEEHPDLTPEVILVDGNGIFHERKAGLATFVGVRTNIPTIGVGKTLYCTDGISVDIVDKGVASKLAKYLKQQDNDASVEGSCIDSWCIICRAPITPDEQSMNEDKDEKEAMSDMVQAISVQCEGFAIPLKGISGEVLAAVLVGHGGKITKKKQRGTKIPIYVSVGHAISLQEAICLCSALSLARIPEPVRQADLAGREMIKRQIQCKGLLHCKENEWK